MGRAPDVIYIKSLFVNTFDRHVKLKERKAAAAKEENK
jgi:hypothetical protein